MLSDFILSMLFIISGLTFVSALFCYLSDSAKLKIERKAFRDLWEQQFFIEYDKEIADKQQDDFEAIDYDSIIWGK